MIKYLRSTALLLLLLVIPLSKTYANMIVTPFKEEVLISTQERLKKTISLTNDSSKSINITPVVYSYDPQNQVLIDTKNYIFVKADKEIFTIAPNSTLTFNYEIIPPANLVPGTYFNIIVLKKQSEKIFAPGENPVGALESLSHLVVMHIVDKDNSVYGISSEFAITNITIEEEGIPFIRPTKIKYIYQNITNYVLTPTGEIQIFNRKGKYPPTYIQINEEGQKLYPGGKIEKVVDINKITISDIFNGRTILGRFYNGIDENFKVVETNQKPNYLFISICSISAGILIILLKSLIEDKRESKKNPVKP
ncbi:MAG: hypothetical protein AB9915_03990 [Candidatus Dojkabacteria bacterium]